MSNYNQGKYEDFNNSSSEYTISRSSDITVFDKSNRIQAGIVAHSGEESFSGAMTINANINIGTSGRIKYSENALTTATTESAIPHGGFITLSSTKTVKTFTLYGSTIGTELTFHCLNATATGYIQVSVASSAGATARTFDGTNYLYKFLKAGESVKIMLMSTGKWFEIGRSVASGTALDSTST